LGRKLGRVGRGEGSKGKTAGRGTKGTKARRQVPATFEGGQMPIIRRLPKRGFNNTDFKPVYAVVNLDTLEERFESGARIDEAALRSLRLVHGRNDGIKLLARGSVTKSFTVEVDKTSAAAREKLEKAGGSLILRERQTKIAERAVLKAAPRSAVKAA
jgi:large subunit ribosomal protein L15